MAALTLMRASEATQLRIKHVQREGEVWYFDLTAPDLSLKCDDDEEAGSPRLVPMHKALIDLGFIDTVVTPRLDRPNELLFPDLEPNPRTGSYATKVLKRFQYLSRLALADDSRERDFGLHPLRHWGTTELANAQGDHLLKDEISGHAAPERFSQRRRYTKLDALLNALRNLIDQISPPMDVDRLVAAANASPTVSPKTVNTVSSRNARRVKKRKLVPRISARAP